MDFLPDQNNRRRHRLGDSPKECLNGRTEVSRAMPSVRVFCQLKIIHLMSVNLHNHAFHNIWQPLHFPCSCYGPHSSPLPSSHSPHMAPLSLDLCTQFYTHIGSAPRQSKISSSVIAIVVVFFVS